MTSTIGDRSEPHDMTVAPLAAYLNSRIMILGSDQILHALSHCQDVANSSP